MSTKISDQAQSANQSSKKIRFTPLMLLIPVVVALLAFLSYDKMLWKMTLYAPMYPKGLVMEAYGEKILGDLREINLLNHYVGMHPITEDAIELMWLYPIGVASLIFAGLGCGFFPRLRKWWAAGAILIPLSMLATIQYYLYYFGHNLNPDAPIDLPPFTPLVLGKNTIVVFKSISLPGSAMLFYVLAALVMWFGPKRLDTMRKKLGMGKIMQALEPSKDAPTSKGAMSSKGAMIARIIILLMITLGAKSAFGRPASDLQSLISAARTGDTVKVSSGTYEGPVIIDRPLALIAEGDVIIDGCRKGSVITVKSDNVLVQGFKIRRSGFEIHEDAAGISISGDNVIVRNNRIEDVYFGIHAIDCGKISLIENDIEPGLTYTSRPGHGINVWNVKSVSIYGNQIRNGRDGILLTYVEAVDVQKNFVTRCRYGLHSMYSQNILFANNKLEDNLLGIALMYSEKMIARGNIMQYHRRGSSPYGFLLKDLDNLIMEDNRIIGNQIGIFADAVSLENNSESHIRNNFIASNEVALSMQSNVRVKFYGNSVVDNLVDFEKQGIRFNAECEWSADGKGNYWSNSRGFDLDKNGISDHQFKVEDLTEHIIDRSSAARAFLYTPSHLALETAIRMFPIFRPAPLLVDEYPLNEMPGSNTNAIAASAGNISLALSLLIVWAISASKVRRWKPLGFAKPVVITPAN
jgi:nitrous oxidase accessory protein